MIDFLAILLAAAQPAPTAQADKPTFHWARRSTDRLRFMDGVWIGPAWRLDPNGVRLEFEQMERVGPMQGGAIRLMEGAGRLADGRGFFSALTVFADDGKDGIEMRSYVFGHMRSRPLQVLADGGFVWDSVEEGGPPIRYTARIRDGLWHEVGEQLLASGEKKTIFEMRLKRVADTDWPARNPDFPTK